MQNVYSKIQISPCLQFTVACPAEACDDLSLALAAGNYPRVPESDLMDRFFQPGARILDLGAHLGFVALLAAAKGCQVIAVEASPRNAEVLQESKSINRFANLKVVHAAVSDRSGVLEFCPQGPYGCVATPGIDSNSVPVRAITVDQILEEAGWHRVDFIKMDIEGSEIAALGGMQGLLSKDESPPILYESNRHTLNFYGKLSSELKTAVERFGYKNHTPDHEKLVQVRAEDFQPLTVADYLAFKKKPELLRPWPILPPISREALVQQVLAACADEVQKVHIARDLRKAPDWILARNEVRLALASLRKDPRAEVRSAARWSNDLFPRIAWRERIASLWKRSA